MRYTVRFFCFNDPGKNIEHNANDYDQAKHFFWALVLRKHQAYKEIDTDQWELTLWSNPTNETEKPSAMLHFSKTS